jgi:DNA-binding CsgD family transcriptional regulator
MSSGLYIRDRAILDMATAGKTSAEIAAHMETNPSRVVTELSRLTDTLDWLSELQELKLAMRSLKGLVGSLKEVAEGGRDDKQTKNYIDALRLLFERIDNRSEKVDADLDRVRNAQARKMVEIVEKSLYHSLGVLGERFPDLPNAEIEGQFRESLVIVSAEYDSDEN